LKRPFDLIVLLLSAYGFIILIATTLTTSLKPPYVVGVNDFHGLWGKIFYGIAFVFPALGVAFLRILLAKRSTIHPPAVQEGVKKTDFSIREDGQHKIEVHVAGLCFRHVGKKIQLLVGHRTESRKLYPNLWECGGGQVRVEESFETALRRQFAEEFGIKIEIIRPFAAYEITRSDGPKIPGIVFFCVSVENGRENITINKREFSESQWVSEAQCKTYNLISGIQKQAEEAFVLAKNHFFPKQRLAGVASPQREQPPTP